MNLVALARRTLERVPIASLATVLPDGRPWNSPLFVAFDEDLTFYWSSHSDAVHSANIVARPHVILVVFDSTRSDQTGHAVYLRGQAREVTDKETIKTALVHLARRKHETPKALEDFLGAHPRRIYQATIDMAWTNVVKEANGHYFDERIAIDLWNSSA